MLGDDTIIYFDLGVRGVVSKKVIVKEVQHFIKIKEHEQSSSNWGIVAFHHGEDNPRFHEGLVKDEAGLEPFLKDNLKFTTKSHPLEQGLMLASTYLVDAYRTTRNHVLRMIVISDGPTEGSNAHLVEALLDLLDTIKHFPVFIDIIRVGDERVYPDDVKLKIIAEKTNGQVYYAATDDAFKDIMEKLLEKSPDAAKVGTVSIEKRTYFESLCWSLVEKEVHGVTCVACGQGEQQGLVLHCENCGTPYHGTCASGIAQREYEAFPGIFRCKKCDCLLNTASRRIIVPKSQPMKKPAIQAKAEPVRITIKAGGDASAATAQSASRSQSPASTDEFVKVQDMPAGATVPPAPATASEKLAPAGISFSVKPMSTPGQASPAAAKPAAPSMKPPATVQPAMTKPSPSRPRGECDDDITVISVDECALASDGSLPRHDEEDSIVIMNDKASGRAKSFWKKGM